MSAEVITFPGDTTLGLPPDRVLEAAVGKLDTVLILGYDSETGEEYFASSVTDRATILWLLERLKHDIVSGIR